MQTECTAGTRMSAPMGHDAAQALAPQQIRERYEFFKSVTSSADLKSGRKLLAHALQNEPVDAGAILDAVSTIPAFAFLLAQDSRTLEGYTIAEHESCWLATYERYIAGHGVVLPLRDSAIRLMGVLHDIGKSLPDSKADQAKYTLGVIEDFKELMPIDYAELQIICSLIGNDPIGRYVVGNLEQQASISQRKEIAQLAETRALRLDELVDFAALVRLREPGLLAQQEAARIAAEMRVRAESLNISAEQLFNLHLISYLCDVGAYTYDAVTFNGKRSSPGIEFVFELNPDFELGSNSELLVRDSQRGAMKISAQVAALIGLIENEVKKSSVE